MTNPDDIDIPIEAKIRYIERRKKDLEVARVALTTPDFTFFKKIGHDLKGNAITFGFAPLSSIGEKLEAAAVASNLEELKKLMQEYDSYIQTVRLS